MPRILLTLLGLVTGYLNGAGLGALFLSFYPDPLLPERELLLIAILILGPSGAVVGSVVARAETHWLQSESLSEER